MGGEARPVRLGAGVKVVGETEAGRRRAIGVTVADARHHLHVVGVTGVGKSTLLLHLALADLNAGRGLVVLDPKGDLVGDLLARIPEHRIGDVALIDPAEQAAPPALNVLEGTPAALVADQVVGVFARVFSAWWGPRTDDVFRSACLTLLHAGGATLADVPVLLSDPRARAPLVARVTDPVLRGFWSWYDGLSEAGRSAAVAPLMNKLRAVLARPLAADLLGSARSSIDVGAVLDGGALLCRLPKGVVGEDTASLVGSLVMAKVWQAALARAELAEDERRDAAVILDECQNFLHLAVAVEDVLAEARGFAVSLTLAHQNLGQLPPSLAAAAFANARTKVYFETSAEDARVLARHVEPTLSAYDLAHLGPRRVAVRVVRDGADLTPFTLATRPKPPAIAGRAAAVRAASRERFGVSRDSRREEALRRRGRAGRRGAPSAGASPAVSPYGSPGVSPYASDAQGATPPSGPVTPGDTPAGRVPDSWSDS